MKDWYDISSSAVMTLHDFYGERRNIVDTCLIILSTVLHDCLLSHYECSEIGRIHACNGDIVLYQTMYKDKKIAFYLSAIGSAIGAGCASMSALGAWKKCYANGKPASFIMVAFAGAPLTQTIYGFLLMNFIRSAVEGGCDSLLAMFTGIFAGLAIGLSAFFQGKVAADSADALGETGKGTANYFIVIGIIETVALFTLVFSLLLLQ